YLSGSGVPKDPARATTYLDRACAAHQQQACDERACGAGQLDRCESAAAAYATGNGAFLAIGRASLLYSQACTGGRASACQVLNQLTTALPAGPALQLVNADHPTMAFTRSVAQQCDRGIPQFCQILGDLFLLGIDVHRDPTIAIHQFQQACTR